MKTIIFISALIVTLSTADAYAQQKHSVSDNSKTVFSVINIRISVSTDGGSTWRQLGKTDMTDEEAQQEQKNPLNIAPNPANNAAELSFVMEEKIAAEISLVSLDGKIHFTKQMDCRQGKNSMSLPTQNLAAGAYYCIVRYGTTVKRSLFLIQ